MTTQKELIAKSLVHSTTTHRIITDGKGNEVQIIPCYNSFGIWTNWYTRNGERRKTYYHIMRCELNRDHHIESTSYTEWELENQGYRDGNRKWKIYETDEDFAKALKRIASIINKTFKNN